MMTSIWDLSPFSLFPPTISEALEGFVSHSEGAARRMELAKGRAPTFLALDLFPLAFHDHEGL